MINLRCRRCHQEGATVKPVVFKDRTKHMQADCPHCKHVFYVSKKTLRHKHIKGSELFDLFSRAMVVDCYLNDHEKRYCASVLAFCTKNLYLTANQAAWLKLCVEKAEQRCAVQ